MITNLENLEPLAGFNCEQILCWVGSAMEPDKIVQVAKSLAKQSSGVFQVVMCLDAGKNTPLTPELISQTARNLSRLYGENVPTMVLPGNPLSEIKRYAKNNSVDLIVMGEQGLDIEQEYDQRLIDDAPCAILILIPTKDKYSNPNAQEK
jgi:nucleotide-binding universal stress UspA family protein